jgi:hypothetical protein
MTVRVAHVSHGSHPRDSHRVLGAHGHRAQLIIVGDGMGDIVLDKELMPAIDGDLHVVAHSHLGALGHRSASGIGQGALGPTARRDLLHTSARALLARCASRDLVLKRLSGRVMGTGCRAIGGIQITQGLRHLLIQVLKSLLKFGLRKILVFAVDGLEFTAIDSQECCPNAIPLPAQEDKRTAKSLPRLGVLLPEISPSLTVGSEFSQPPDALHVALGFPLQSSAGSKPVAVAIDVEREQIPWIIGRSTRECGLSPRKSKTRKIKTLHVRIDETNRMLFRDIVIEKLGSKKPWGPAVSLNGAHPASLLCLGGRLYWSVRWHTAFSHSLPLQRTQHRAPRR